MWLGVRYGCSSVPPVRGLVAPFTPCASSRAVCTDPNIGDAPPRRFRDSSETRWRAAARDVRDSSGGAPRPGRAVLPAVHGEVLWSGEARQRDALMSHVSNRSQGMRGSEREGDPGRDRQGARRASDASVDWPPLSPPTAHVVTSAVAAATAAAAAAAAVAAVAAIVAASTATPSALDPFVRRRRADREFESLVDASLCVYRGLPSLPVDWCRRFITVYR